MYEYNYESEDDDDYEDQDDADETKPPVPAGSPPKDSVSGSSSDNDDDVDDNEDEDDSDDSVVIEVNGGDDSNKQISRTFFVTLIAGSAVITFITLMLAFYIYRYTNHLMKFCQQRLMKIHCLTRTIRSKNKQKLKPFIVSPAAYGPPPISTSVRSAPIVKNYQRVPTSTKEFLYQQQQLQLQQESETKAPLLT